MRNEHSARRRGRFTAHAYPHYQIRIFTLLNTCFRFNAHTYPHYQLRVFTLLNTYIHFTEYVHLHYRTRISTLPNTCICIIEYTFPHHRTRISVCHFVGVYVYAGAINRTLRLLTDCDNVANTNEIHTKHSAKCQRTIREMRNEHSARRRGPIHRARILTLSNMYIHIIAHAYPHYRIRAFTPPHAHFRHPFCG